MQAQIAHTIIGVTALLLLGCSGGGGGEEGSVPVAVSTDTGRLAVRVNGVRIYSKQRPTTITQYNSEGAAVGVSELSFDPSNATEAISLQVIDGGELSVAGTTVRAFDAEGRLTNDEILSGAEIVSVTQTFSGEQIISRRLTGNSNGSSREVIVRYDNDDFGRTVQAKFFKLPEDILVWKSNRIYREDGWTTRFTAFNPDGSEFVSTKTITLNSAGQISEVVNLFAESANVQPSKSVYSYDEQGRVTELVYFDDASSNTPVSRTEFAAYVDTDDAYHDFLQAVVAFDFEDF